jgi:FAD/FMN-containing dehydrogenase
MDGGTGSTPRQRWQDAVRTPLLRLPEDELCYAFNLIRIPADADATESGRLVQANRAIYDRVLAAGGTPYPVSAFPMTQRDWQRHFGPAWTQLREAKRRFDPHNVLAPGYDLFPRA